MSPAPRSRNDTAVGHSEAQGAEIPTDLLKRPGPLEQVQTSGMTLLGTRRSDA